MKIKLSTAVMIMIAIISAFIWMITNLASSEELKTLTKDVRYIELIQLNQVIMIYQKKYGCYLPVDCLPKMNGEDTITYMRLQEDKTKLLDKIEGKK